MQNIPDMQAWRLNRRRWLQLSGGGLASAVGAVGLSSLLQTPAQAQAQPGYKALVCVFLYGGNDGMNTVLPTDNLRYAEYARVRADLALPQHSLVPIDGTDLGLHPAMAALAPICQARKLAPVLNVGPLHEPLSKSAYRNAAAMSPLIPDGLFSHSDQQVLWEAGSARAHARTGWGGRAAHALGTANPVIAVGGNGRRFGLSETQTPLVLPEPGGMFGLEGVVNSTSLAAQARATALTALYGQPHDNVLLQSYVAQQSTALEVSARLGALVRRRPGDLTGAAIDQAFAPITSGNQINTGIGRQLYQVAKLVEGRQTVLGGQQIFFVQQGGYDTHANQISAASSTEGTHADLLTALAQAMACFYQAMQAIGMGESVTLFTQSEFGRTFLPNSSKGTDHGWGNHQLVLGAAVRGGVAYGSYPQLSLGGPDDVGVNHWELHGRWIPTLSVEQYAATLLGWLGANDLQLEEVLPRLRFFTPRQIGFV